MLSKIKLTSESNYNQFRKYFPFGCVDILIFENDRVLLTKRTRNPYKDLWHLPGSMIRKNELMIETAKRAAKSELNFKIKIENYLGVYESLNNFRHDLSHGFIVSIKSGKLINDSQSSEVKFFKRIPTDTVPHHKKMIKDALHLFRNS